MYRRPMPAFKMNISAATDDAAGVAGLAMVCTATDLPIAWNVRTASEAEQAHAMPLIDTANARGFAVETCAMDNSYDARHIYEGCEARDVRPTIPLRESTGGKRGDHKPPT